MKNGSPVDKARPRDMRATIQKALVLCGFALIVSLTLMTGLSLQRFVGGALISVVLLFILYRDIMRYKPTYIQSYNMFLLLGLMIVSTMAIGRFFEFLLPNLAQNIEFIAADTAVYGIPIAAGGMLVALLFDFHTAITFSFTVSLLTGFWLNDPFYPLYTFVSSLTAAFSVIRCKRRSAILVGGVYVVVTNIILVLVLLLTKNDFHFSKAVSAVIFAVFSGITVSSIVSLLLPLLEYVFKVTTDISLLELLDLNQPIMKSLMITAPGTYHHSVIVGNLVESAAEAVGVNPLLARVSAYYHDIGKIKMPEYFVENQGGQPSKHEKLTPHMSSMIITSHVKEGVELARQSKLPQAVIDIIGQHHGSALITYFYQKAKEHDLAHEPSMDEYKYPGPKPQTRVAALVMMADAVEAASRVLNDPTPARITALVDRIINHIFLDGQLDECELTLKDISEIKRRFTYILTGIFHKRIDYPGFDFSDGSTPKEPAKIDKTRPQEDKRGFAQGAHAARSGQG